MSDANIQQKRLRILIGVVIAIGLAVIVRLFSLQILNTSEYRARAERQYVTPSGASFDRGTIYFSTTEGDTVAAATIESGFKAAIAPAQIIDVEGTYNALSAIVPIDEASFIAKAKKKTDPYEEVAERISAEDGAKIVALKLPGVTLYRQKWRFYPGGSMASKAIGFVSYKGDTLVGNYGLEEYYNDVLARSAGSFYVNFFAEIFANVQSSIFKNTHSTGDIVTSINPVVQAQLEDIIEGVERDWSSDAVGGLVLDPYTGEILAMANVPTFDLNAFGAQKDVGIYGNPLAQNVYEMGSIIKPIVMASAIDAGAVTPDTTYIDSGSVVVNNKTISNFDKKGRGRIDMQDVLNQSLNTGMVFTEQRMGKERFREYMLDRFKLGTKTEVDLPGEVNGLVSSLKGDNDINYATASFGQGVATTPMNIVRGFGALANGGYLVTPHLAKSIVRVDGTVETLEHPRSETSVIKPETASTISTMLTRVVDDGYGRGLEHYRVAAKTGTAQIAMPNGGGYYEDRNLHSLIGYFPASKPRFVLYLYNVYPKGALYAIQTLGDPFFDMVKFLTNYYHIAPDR